MMIVNSKARDRMGLRRKGNNRRDFEVFDALIVLAIAPCKKRPGDYQELIQVGDTFQLFRTPLTFYGYDQWPRIVIVLQLL